MQIIVDSREQNPFTFACFDCTVIPGTLPSGDYSLAGFEDLVAVERKNLSDLIGCFTSGRERFVREMERLRGFASCAIVVESPWCDLAKGSYRSKLPANNAVQTVISIIQHYRMPFYFAANRADAERFTYDFLRHFLRHAKERYKAAGKM